MYMLWSKAGCPHKASVRCVINVPSLLLMMYLMLTERLTRAD